MKQGIGSSGNMPSRRLAQLAAPTTLLAFLVGQSSVFCLPLCLLEGHAAMALPSPAVNHAMPCHSGKVAVSPPAVGGSLAMVPSRSTPLLLSFLLLAIRFAPPVSADLYQLPPQDPPPPRSV